MVKLKPKDSLTVSTLFLHENSIVLHSTSSTASSKDTNQQCSRQQPWMSHGRKNKQFISTILYQAFHIKYIIASILYRAEQVQRHMLYQACYIKQSKFKHTFYIKHFISSNLYQANKKKGSIQNICCFKMVSTLFQTGFWNHFETILKPCSVFV